MRAQSESDALILSDRPAKNDVRGYTLQRVPRRSCRRRHTRLRSRCVQHSCRPQAIIRDWRGSRCRCRDDLEVSVERTSWAKKGLRYTLDGRCGDGTRIRADRSSHRPARGFPDFLKVGHHGSRYASTPAFIFHQCRTATLRGDFRRPSQSFRPSDTVDDRHVAARTYRDLPDRLVRSGDDHSEKPPRIRRRHDASVQRGALYATLRPSTACRCGGVHQP